MYFPINFKYSLNAFKTKQVLDKSYQKYTDNFEYKDWIGEYNKRYNQKDIQTILDAFKKDKGKYFKLVHKTDYRYVYRSKNLPIDIYLKEYKIWEASYSKFTIIKRNILRKTLAKKAFALSFKLQEIGINTIESIFYAKLKEGFIPKNSIYVSLAISDSIPISYYFENLKNKKPRNNFTNNFKEKVEKIDNNVLKYRYMNFIKQLIDSGIRGFYREFEGNILISYTKNDFTLILCDLDIIDAIYKFDKQEKSFFLQEIEKRFERLIDEVK